MSAQSFSLRSKLLPTVISRTELERVSTPAAKKAIMGEFLTNCASINPVTRRQAAQLTAENVASYGLLTGSLVAQMPLVLFGSWQPLPVVLARLPGVTAAMTKDTSATNYLALEAFNRGVRAAIANGPSGEF